MISDVERFGVQSPESYLYTSRSRCYSADGIDDHADFAETIKAMGTIGLSQQEIDDIFKILASVLWLGNVQFAENNEGNAAIADESVPTYVAYLMDVDASSVIKVFYAPSQSDVGVNIAYNRSTAWWSARIGIRGPTKYHASDCCS